MASRLARRHRGGRKGSTRGGSTDAGAGRSTTTTAAATAPRSTSRRTGGGDKAQRSLLEQRTSRTRAGATAQARRGQAAALAAKRGNLLQQLDNQAHGAGRSVARARRRRRRRGRQSMPRAGHGRRRADAERAERRSPVVDAKRHASGRAVGAASSDGCGAAAAVELRRPVRLTPRQTASIVAATAKPTIASADTNTRNATAPASERWAQIVAHAVRRRLLPARALEPASGPFVAACMGSAVLIGLPPLRSPGPRARARRCAARPRAACRGSAAARA